jgi:hypothetical protein
MLTWFDLDTGERGVLEVGDGFELLALDNNAGVALDVA